MEGSQDSTFSISEVRVWAEVRVSLKALTVPGSSTSLALTEELRLSALASWDLSLPLAVFRLAVVAWQVERALLSSV